MTCSFGFPCLQCWMVFMSQTTLFASQASSEPIIVSMLVIAAMSVLLSHYSLRIQRHSLFCPTDSFFALLIYKIAKYSGKSVKQTFLASKSEAAIPTIPVPEPNYKQTLPLRSSSAILVFLFQQQTIVRAPSQTVPAWLRVRSWAMAISLPFTQTTRSIISKQTQVKYNQMEKDVASIRLVFTRHGETEENAKGIICGQQPGTLTKVGVAQAKKIGVYLKDQNEQFDQIYVSDLGRTVATFENIKSQAKHLDKIPVVLTKLLREKAGGVLEGRPLMTWKQEAQKQKKDIRDYKCAKGESWCDVNQRCWDFLKLLVETHIMKVKKQQDLTKIFAVSHGGYLMEFHNMVAKIMEKKDPVFKNSAKNCSLHDFIIEYPMNCGPVFNVDLVSIKCVRQNFTDHLK